VARADGPILPSAATALPTSTRVPPTPAPTATAISDTATGASTATTPTVSAAALLAQADAVFGQAAGRRERAGLETALALLDRAEAANPKLAPQGAALRSRIGYAMDVLSGTVYLDADNTVRWNLVAAGGKPLVNPIDFTIGPTGLYVIDSGTVYAAPLAELAQTDGKLALTAILTPTAEIGGYPVKEVMALDAANTTDDLFVLDKSGDLYRYTPSSRTWQLENLAASRATNPDPIFLNVASWSNRLYVLDPARNQVWRHPPGQSGDGFLPGKFPWLLKPGEPDVSAGIDLAVDGAVFVLRRNGNVTRYFLDKAKGYQLQQSQFSLAVADGRSHVVELEVAPSRPIALHATDESLPLYIADSGRHRVIALDRETGAFLRQFAAPDDLAFASLHGIAEWDGRLYLLAGPRLYSYDVRGGITTTLPLTGQLPVWQPASQPDPATLRVTDLAPNDPRVPALLATYQFTMPLRGALLPDRPAIYPGARRAYRYGVHEGLDMYQDDVGVKVKVGTPVYAAGDGIVTRADSDYVEMTLPEVNGLLDESNARHDTPPEILDKLGGRQIWLDHGNGVATRYLHLDGIAEGITVTQQVKAGQLIGYVGLSGTPDGISGDQRYTHLHFEFRVGQGERAVYLGRWLTIEDARRAYELILNVPVRPAYLEFRQEGGETP
jgi:murein DD-endopeptidase MepM/ murein hydrolase activator NlpD